MERRKHFAAPIIKETDIDSGVQLAQRSPNLQHSPSPSPTSLMSTSDKSALLTPSKASSKAAPHPSTSVSSPTNGNAFLTSSPYKSNVAQTRQPSVSPIPARAQTNSKSTSDAPPTPIRKSSRSASVQSASQIPTVSKAPAPKPAITSTNATSSNSAKSASQLPVIGRPTAEYNMRKSTSMNPTLAPKTTASTVAKPTKSLIAKPALAASAHNTATHTTSTKEVTKSVAQETTTRMHAGGKDADENNKLHYIANQLHDDTNTENDGIVETNLDSDTSSNITSPPARIVNILHDNVALRSASKLTTAQSNPFLANINEHDVYEHNSDMSSLSCSTNNLSCTSVNPALVPDEMTCSETSLVIVSLTVDNISTHHCG